MSLFDRVCPEGFGFPSGQTFRMRGDVTRMIGTPRPVALKERPPRLTGFCGNELQGHLDGIIA
jgi:hypothetical protein